MKQLNLNLSIDHTQPLVHCVEFYDSNPAIQAIWTWRSFKQFINKKHSFFGDTVISLRSGVFLRESFLGRLNELLLVNNQLIDVNKYSEK